MQYYRYYAKVKKSIEPEDSCINAGTEKESASRDFARDVLKTIEKFSGSVGIKLPPDGELTEVTYFGFCA